MACTPSGDGDGEARKGWGGEAGSGAAGVGAGYGAFGNVTGPSWPFRTIDSERVTFGSMATGSLPFGRSASGTG